jgi:hypothetical protein
MDKTCPQTMKSEVSMGYSTMLYAVNIGELKAAFGSKNAALLERVREVASRKDGTASRVDPTR